MKHSDSSSYLDLSNTRDSSAVTKILIVEDNEMNRDMLSRRLRRKGFDVIIAVDGQEGVDRARSDDPDVVLMDMNLPVLDGWEATRKLRRDPVTVSLPVIALTAHAMAGDRAKALEAGCTDYETKPVNLARLLEKIARYCSTDPQDAGRNR